MKCVKPSSLSEPYFFRKIPYLKYLLLIILSYFLINYFPAWIKLFYCYPEEFIPRFIKSKYLRIYIYIWILD